MSLENLLRMGVTNIQQERQPLMGRLYEELSTRYQPLTPSGSTSSIISFALKDADKVLAGPIQEAGINIELYDNRFRVSPSIYNSMNDIDRLIDVLLA